MGLGTVFLSHYRRHPGQLAGLLLILVCAAMLWSGVRALTGSAENAVARSRAALEPLVRVVREDGHPLAVEDFVQLRRVGLCASPQLEVRFPVSDAPTVIGIDPFSAGCLLQYRELPDGNNARTNIADKLLSSLNRRVLLGSPADLARWRQASLPGAAGMHLESFEGLPRGQLFTDISLAAELAAGGQGTLAILLPAAETERSPLPPDYLSQVEDYGVKPDPMVDAFLLSLNALGALALLVAALLVRSVYRFALEQRRRSLEIMVRLGVRSAHLRWALIVEVLLVASVGGILGVFLGERLASAMAEGFEGTLAGLFSVDALTKRPPTVKTWLGMVLILAVVVGWACLDLISLRRSHWGGAVAFASSTGSAESAGWRRAGALLVASVSLVVLLSTNTLWVIFVSTMGCLLGVGILLPELLSGVLALLERRGRRPLMEWSCSEMGALCRLLGLPLTALVFAIATTIGVQAMVTGFESTFARWLDQRLQGDLYLDPGRPIATEAWRRQLREVPGITAVLPMVRGRALLGPPDLSPEASVLPVDVLAVDPDSPLLQDWPFLASVPSVWNRLAAGGVLVNEQLARRQSLSVGDRLQIRAGAQQLSREVLGIYADYGRPEGEVMVPLKVVTDALPNRYTAFVLGVSDVQNMRWRDWPEQYSWLNGSRLRDQAGLKAAANRAFSRTFQMTRLLNSLTLILTGTALALMGLVTFRMRQGSYTLLHVYGVPRKSLRRRLVAHSMLVTGLLALLAIPLGIFLGWVLVARVNPAAFGWALPLHFYPGFWLQVWLACLFIGALVGLLVGNPVRLETMKNE
ncbi:FtsX-like permease family protein [Microbulbifer aggregans]|uniref:FtsX-like permease family protein n=1 Tax=Microbulbifer aggregans TaxID=1769779 RepID=UPI001CFE8B82|nr:FtsX-like permease family protein [Microbulbifer aggregans]